jgi:hypothetical protein
MGAILGAIFTALFTALFGFLTFLAGQVVLKLFEPAFELRTLFGEIARDFIVYGYRDSTSDPEKRVLLFREHAGSLHQKLFKVAWYGFFQRIIQLPPKEDVVEAAALLILYSGYHSPTSVVLKGPKAWELAENIRRLLRLEIPREERENKNNSEPPTSQS